MTPGVIYTGIFGVRNVMLWFLHVVTFSPLSGWYWGPITATEAKQRLQKMAEGVFLVRDSTHPSYLFTLSVRTNRGPTNVRIEYSDSLFRLDSNWLSKPRILSFPDVVSLVQYYVSSCSSESSKDPDSQSPVAPTSLKEPTAVHLKLLRPLHRSEESPSLQHLCRLQINRSMAPGSDLTELPLPKRMVEYLQRYPFKLWFLQGRTVNTLHILPTEGAIRPRLYIITIFIIISHTQLFFFLGGFILCCSESVDHSPQQSLQGFTCPPHSDITGASCELYPASQDTL